MNKYDEDNLSSPLQDDDQAHEAAHLWVISYSDFMTILMIFFLVLFAHRVWAKKVFWENEKAAQIRSLQEAQKGMVQRLNKLANVDVAAERINIHLPDALMFQSGRADLKDSARSLLAGISPDLSAFKGEVVVEGHTDNEPLGSRSRFKSNWELSIARAFSVIKCLTENGVDPQHLSARGYGEYRPRSPNDTPEHRAENRRIEVILLSPRKA